ncbi:hypothetical protein AgCh_030876 [Apium graveolens]
MANTSYNLYYDLETNRLQLIRTTIHPNGRTYEEYLDFEDQIGPVDSEETVMIGGQNSSDSYDEPTYEEYLELEERIGRVDSRLSEKTIMGNLKITSYETSSKRMDEADICVVCQDEYEKDELIGGLECRHEYHVECIKRWLKQAA